MYSNLEVELMVTNSPHLTAGRALRLHADIMRLHDVLWKSLHWHSTELIKCALELRSGTMHLQTVSGLYTQCLTSVTLRYLAWGSIRGSLKEISYQWCGGSHKCCSRKRAWNAREP